MRYRAGRTMVSMAPGVHSCAVSMDAKSMSSLRHLWSVLSSRSVFYRRAFVPISLLVLLLLPSQLLADETHTRNERANKLYEDGKYEDALKIYEDALLVAPDDTRLKINKGSAQYRLGQFDQAEQSYQEGLSEEEKKVRADAHYNLGNALYRQGQQMVMAGGQDAQEKFKGALENYIKALDLHPSDRDAKWNLELTRAVIDQLEKQQQQDKKNDKNDKKKDDKQDKNQDGQQDKKNQEQQKDQNQDDQQEKKDQQKQDQDQQQQNQADKEKKDQQKPQPAEMKEEEMKKKQAEKLLQQFADDDKLNKPVRIGVVKERNPEKDW